MPDIEYTIDKLLGPHGKMVVRDTINLCKNEWKMNKDETIARVAEKFSYNAEIENAAVTYAQSIYECCRALREWHLPNLEPHPGRNRHRR